MLANAYGIVFYLAGAVAGTLSLVAAVLLEAPILAGMWRRRWREILPWVVRANIWSAVIGVFPVVCLGMAQAPGLNADPWDVYQSGWIRHLLHVLILLAITLPIEVAILRGRSRKAGLNLAAARVLTGVTTANLASYALLFSCVLYQSRSTGDFELRPDTSWLGGRTERAYFLEPETATLYSMALDGSDRRQEVETKLARFEGIWDHESVYAVAPERNMILFVDEREDWRTKENGLTAPATGERRYARQFSVDRKGIAQSLAEVLQQRKFPVSAPVTWSSNFPGVFFSGSDETPWSMSAHTPEMQVSTNVYWADGSGSGLSVARADGQQLNFRIKAGVASLACRSPAILDTNVIVFRCGGWIMVMDMANRRVGRLARGDSLVLPTPAFSRVAQEP